MKNTVILQIAFLFFGLLLTINSSQAQDLSLKEELAYTDKGEVHVKKLPYDKLKKEDILFVNYTKSSESASERSGGEQELYKSYHRVAPDLERAVKKFKGEGLLIEKDDLGNEKYAVYKYAVVPLYAKGYEYVGQGVNYIYCWGLLDRSTNEMVEINTDNFGNGNLNSDIWSVVKYMNKYNY